MSKKETYYYAKCFIVAGVVGFFIGRALALWLP
jgi:hypothetical protein